MSCFHVPLHIRMLHTHFYGALLVFYFRAPDWCITGWHHVYTGGECLHSVMCYPSLCVYVLAAASVYYSFLVMWKLLFSYNCSIVYCVCVSCDTLDCIGYYNSVLLQVLLSFNCYWCHNIKFQITCSLKNTTQQSYRGCGSERIA